MGKRRKPIDRDTTLNVLEDVCKRLIDNPRQLDMSVWGMTSQNPTSNDITKLPCGTVMCLAGHAIHDDRIPLYPVWYNTVMKYADEPEFSCWTIGSRRWGMQEVSYLLADEFVNMCGLSPEEAYFLFLDYEGNDPSELFTRVRWLTAGKSCESYVAHWEV